MILLLVAVFLFFVYRTIVPGRFPRILWTILTGALLLTIVYVFNPYVRIYSIHGFIHTAIVSQVMNGIVPPDNPFLAGQGLFYPWGYHFLVSLIMRVLDLSAFYSYAIINVFSFCAGAVLIYKISRLLYEDKVANCLSVLFSFAGISMFSPALMRIIRSSMGIVIPFPYRATPILKKFTNINGFPVGLVFFLLIVLLAIKFFKTKKIYFYFTLIMVATACGGFFYPVLLPGIMLGVCAICVVNVISDRLVKEKIYGSVKKSFLILSAVSLGIFFLSPYLLAISPGVRKGLIFFSARPAYIKIMKGLVVSLPMLLVLFVNRHFMDNVNKRVLYILWSIAISTFGAYVFIQLPKGVEYKFLIISMVVVGIFSGIVFAGMNRKYNKIVVFTLICLFLIPAKNEVQHKLSWKCGASEICLIEEGSSIYHENKEESELYNWIRKNTDNDSVIIDYTLSVPLFTGRKLFIGLNEWNASGYALDFLGEVCIVDPVLLDERKKIVENIYGIKGDLSDEKMRAFWHRHKNDKIYIVARSAAVQHRFSNMGFNGVFLSSGKKFAIFTPKISK